MASGKIISIWEMQKEWESKIITEEETIKSRGKTKLIIAEGIVFLISFTTFMAAFPFQETIPDGEQIILVLTIVWVASGIILKNYKTI